MLYLNNFLLTRESVDNEILAIIHSGHRHMKTTVHLDSIVKYRTTDDIKP